MRLRPLLAVAALLAGLMLFAACDGGDDNDDGGNADPRPAEATTANGDSSEGNGGAGDDNEGDQGSENGDGADPGGEGSDPADVEDLADVAQRFSNANFRGEYRVTGPPGEDDLENALLVIYKSGSDRVRFDISAEEEGETTEVILIDTPAASAFCLRNAGEFGLLFGIPEGEGVCLSSDPTGGESGGEYGDLIDSIQRGEGEILERSEREIAGEQADCYRIRNAESEIADVCFSDEGYLLASTEPDGSSIEATSVSGDVSDSDFELPYEVQELPDLGAE